MLDPGLAAAQAQDVLAGFPAANSGPEPYFSQTVIREHRSATQGPAGDFRLPTRRQAHDLLGKGRVDPALALRAE